MSSQKIRIRLKGYDHEVIDQSAKLIVDTAQKTGARVSGPIPLPTERIFTLLFAHHTRIRIPVISLRCALTSVSSIFSTQALLPLIRLCVSTFQLVSISRSSSKHTA